MQDNALIPLSRTATAISVDAIIDSLDELAKALGPNGTNAHGASRLSSQPRRTPSVEMVPRCTRR